MDESPAFPKTLAILSLGVSWQKAMGNRGERADLNSFSSC